MKVQSSANTLRGTNDLLREVTQRLDAALRTITEYANEALHLQAVIDARDEEIRRLTPEVEKVQRMAMKRTGAAA